MEKRKYQRKATEREIYCVVCGGVFKSIRSDAMACSPKCRVAACRINKRNPEVVCGAIECTSCGIISYRSRSIPCPVCGVAEVTGGDTE